MTSETQPLPVGAAVLISGITSRPEINGLVGTVMLYDKIKGRYGVRLSPDGVEEEILLKPECLEPVDQESGSSSDGDASSDGEAGSDEAGTEAELQQRLQSVEAAIQEMEAEMPEAGPRSVRLMMESEHDEWEYNGVRVQLGSDKHANQPTLVKDITEMINKAYYEANKPFLHPSQTTFERVDFDEVHGRLMMGTPGSVAANRVLLLAYVEGKLAGACSSTFSVPWAEEGCGHWGLLVSDTQMWGKGVASALVAVAEHRVAGQCTAVRMEYEFVPSDPHSERLRRWYEGPLNFACIQARRQGGGCQWRTCQKDFDAAMLKSAQRDRLRQIQKRLNAQLKGEGSMQNGNSYDLWGHRH